MTEPTNVEIIDYFEREANRLDIEQGSPQMRHFLRAAAQRLGAYDRLCAAIDGALKGASDGR
jgi:hypothetical protein